MMAFQVAVAGAAAEAAGRVVVVAEEVIPVVAAVDTQAAVAAILVEGVGGEAAIARRILTAGRSWRKLRPVPVAATLRPRRRTISKISTTRSPKSCAVNTCSPTRQ